MNEISFSFGRVAFRRQKIMGYDLVRVVDKIDPEFLCRMCKLVLENPVQIPCDHLFCYNCIKRRIATDKTCPVDLNPIKLSGESPVFKAPCMAFRNLLYKLNIRCDFRKRRLQIKHLRFGWLKFFALTETVGCSNVMKMEDLADHVRSCKFNYEAEVVCDSGCNLTVTRREYLTSNCSSHMKQEIENLKLRVNFQRKRFEGLANCLYDRIDKLNDEMNCNRTEKQQMEILIRHQQQEIARLKCKSLSDAQPKWQLCHNITVDEWNNLKIEDYDSSTYAFVQSYYPLQPARPCFQIKLSKLTTATSVQRGIWIGLTRKGHSIVRNPEARSIAWIWNGRIQLDDECLAQGPRWEDEDVIEVGLIFSKDFVTEVNGSAMVSLNRNGKMFFEKRMKIPKDGFFPTLCIYGKDTKVAYTFR